MTDLPTRRSRIALPWRVAFVAYALVLEVSTHWPALVLGEGAPTDKSIHMLAFGVATVLLWQTRWFARLGPVFLIVLAWAIVDEWSQGIPAIRRTVSWQDLAANVLGVVLAATWIWALRPVGGTGNRLRLARHRHVFDEIFAHGKAWVVLIGVFVACAVPIAIVWRVLEPIGIEGPLAFAVAIWGLATGIVWSGIWRAHEKSAVENRACFTCGASCAGAEFDELGRGTCPSCGGAVHVGQWVQFPRPPFRSLLRLAVTPAAVGVSLLVLGFVAIYLTVVIYDRLLTTGILSPGLPRLVRVIGQERALMNAVDFAAVFIVLAIVARLFRRRLADYYDQPFTCRKCGHDLRGTPTSGGVGRCGECGHEFTRAAELAGMGYADTPRAAGSTPHPEG